MSLKFALIWLYGLCLHGDGRPFPGHPYALHGEVTSWARNIQAHTQSCPFGHVLVSCFNPIEYTCYTFECLDACMLHVGFLPLLIIMLAMLECHRITGFTLQLGEGCVYSTPLEHPGKHFLK